MITQTATACPQPVPGQSDFLCGFFPDSDCSFGAFLIQSDFFVVFSDPN